MIFRQDNPTLSRTIPMARDRDAMPLPTDPTSILEHFALLPDPRREHGQVHRLDEVVFMAICGVLCGADSWQEIADYSESKLDWLSTFLSLPGGIPSHDTFRRVFCLLDSRAPENGLDSKALVLLSGAVKRVGSTVDRRAYTQALTHRANYLKTRRIVLPTDPSKSRPTTRPT